MQFHRFRDRAISVSGVPEVCARVYPSMDKSFKHPVGLKEREGRENFSIVIFLYGNNYIHQDHIRNYKNDYLLLYLCLLL